MLCKQFGARLFAILVALTFAVSLDMGSRCGVMSELCSDVFREGMSELCSDVFRGGMSELCSDFSCVFYLLICMVALAWRP